MGRITPSFRTILQREMNELKKGYAQALMDMGRREAFKSLIKAWSSEAGAMSYAKIPYVLDAMQLTALIDNRKHILELVERARKLESQVKKLLEALGTNKDAKSPT